jgi:hypothetical protein
MSESVTDNWGIAHRPVGTWVSVQDFEALKRLAQAHNIRMSAYLRAIITDAIQEEQYSSQLRTGVISTNPTTIV